jgi:hypothetical protein
MTRAAALLAVLAIPSLAHAGKFGGFSSDGSKVLDGDSRVCTPVVAAETGTAFGTPECARVSDKKDLAAHGFRKPKPSRKTPDGTFRLDAAFAERTLTLTAARDGAKEVVLAAWEATDPIGSIVDLYVSPDGSLVAVDYVAKTLRGDLPATVTFDVRKPLAAARAAADRPADGDEPPAKPEIEVKHPDGNAFDRAMKHGGAWEQPLVACDQARVTLKLKKDRKFSIRIETRCQGDKWVTKLDGKWISEGNDDVALTFENDDGTVEAMPCRLGFDPEAKEDLLECAQEDVTFTMKPAKR